LENEIDKIKEKITIAREAVSNQVEPFKTEGFKVILANLLNQGTVSQKKSKKGRTLKRKSVTRKKDGTWYQSGSTTEKIIILVNNAFFSKNRTINDIIEKLKSMDYHFKASELTMSMRSIVRRDILTKTKDLPDGKKSKLWTYITHE